MSRKRYSISFLAGHGIGAEITAQASRVDGRRGGHARLHARRASTCRSASDAFVRYGNPFPPASRRAVAASDAVLVPADDGGALDALEAELDLQASVVRVRVDGRDAGDARRAARRGRTGSGRSSGRSSSPVEAARRLTLVRADDRPRRLAAAAALEADGIAFERVGLGDAVRRLVEEPRGMDVLLCRPEDVATAAEVAGCTSPTRVAAWGRVGPQRAGRVRADARPGDRARRPGRRRSRAR